ncbi:DNA-binding transcriptional LysR family regulator [Paraburkholderia sp. GV068]|nr:DNA-binding transcriptional LysR family regulator [Paraburkholderia sp. GV072]PUA93979.1 DNA-binding transcriptional LysR family regulator [Paraburkholderia sp. GV068]
MAPIAARAIFWGQWLFGLGTDSGNDLTTAFTRQVASTRFSPPRIGSKTVRRADLLTHLERMRHATLALVTGSAGYGKTTLLAQWRERCVKAGADVAWLSLSADEADWSLAAAARRVHLSQPALTRSIQALEAQAGLPLCERGPRGVKLNAAGQMVAERARRILFETNSLARDLVLLQQHEVGSVDFGLGPLPAAIMLPEVLCTLNCDWPGLRVNAEVNEGEALVESLRTERLDFVVVEHRYAPLSAELKIHRLPVEPAGCFVRPQHPLLAGEMTVERLRQAALACVRAPHSAQQRMREVLGCLPGENLRFRSSPTIFMRWFTSRVARISSCCRRRARCRTNCRQAASCS